MVSASGKDIPIPREMTAAVVRDGRIGLRTMPLPDPSPGEALLRIRMSGICGTDLELLRGYQEFSGVPGHELVAEVVRAPGREDLEGERAVADINCGCGTCRDCLCGNTTHCPERTVIGIRGRQGAFADYLSLPLANLHRVPRDLPDRAAVFAEPLAAALRVSQQMHITAPMRAAVLGDGKMGLLSAMALRHLNPDILLLGRHKEKLELFERIGGRTLHTDRDGDSDPPGETPESAFDLVVEATGNPEGIEQASRMCRPRGTIVLKTTAHRSASFPFSRIVVREQHILGSRCGDLDLALHFLGQGLVDPEPLIEAVLPWPKIEEALNRSAARGSRKVLLDHLGTKREEACPGEGHGG